MRYRVLARVSSKRDRTKDNPSLLRNGVITVKMSTAFSATVCNASRVETSEAYARPDMGSAAAIALGEGGIVTTAVDVSSSGLLARIAAAPSRNGTTPLGMESGPTRHPFDTAVSDVLR